LVGGADDLSGIAAAESATAASAPGPTGDQSAADRGGSGLVLGDEESPDPAVAAAEADRTDLAAAAATQPSGLMADFLPVDANAIEAAMQEFLGQLNNLDGDSMRVLTGLGVPPWVLATAIGTTACGMTWRRRKGRTTVVLSAPPGDGDTTSTCLPGAAGDLSAEES
jgi:hypothetical protein